MRFKGFCILTSSVLLTSCLTANTQPAKAPYDNDLFNKDKRIFFATGEFLYWLANESALDYAIKMDSNPWSSTENTAAIGKYQSAVFHWSPGFRLSVGYFNAPHYWDVFAQYTYLRPSGTVSVKAPQVSGQTLTGTWIQPDAGTDIVPLSSAESTVRLNYNLFDFLLSRRFHTNEHFRLNLFGGLATAFLHQHWSISYENTIGQTALIHNRWRFDGLGLRIGTKLDWYMGWDIYLVGIVSGGILSGWYKNTAYEKSSISTTPILNSLYEDHRLAATGQMMFGPSWQKRFESVRVELVAGYELTAWSNLHEAYHSTFSSPSDSKVTAINTSLLTLQGLTVRFNIDF